MMEIKQETLKQEKQNKRQADCILYMFRHRYITHQTVR